MCKQAALNILDKVNVTTPVRVLNEAECERYAQLSEAMQSALATGDAAAYDALFFERLNLAFRPWFYDPAVARTELEEFKRHLEPHVMARIEAGVLGTLGEYAHWTDIERFSAPALLLYGYQDFEPITQAFELREWLPQLELAFLNRCGHLP